MAAKTKRDAIVTVREAAAALGISERRVRQLIENGVIHAEKLGRQIWMIPREALSRVRRNRRRNPPRPGRRPKRRIAKRSNPTIPQELQSTNQG